MKILAAIPAYNEASRICRVVAATKPYATDVVVIDDGSTDATALHAAAAGARVLRHCINRDLGGALQTAFAYARSSDADILVTIDGDGQFQPNEISRLVAPLREGIADVVIGSRFLQKNTVPFFRRCGNYAGNFVTWFFFASRVSDSQSGFRAFSRKAIAVMQLRTSGMEISSEIIKEIYQKHLRVKEVPVTVLYDTYTLSKGQGFVRGLRTFFALLMHRLTR